MLLTQQATMAASSTEQGETGVHGGVSDSIVTEFSTYEDFLDSQITPTDLYYLEVSDGYDVLMILINAHYVRTKSLLVSWWSSATEEAGRSSRGRNLSLENRLLLQANKQGGTKKGSLTQSQKPFTNQWCPSTPQR